MRISDWSSDVCSSDLTWEVSWDIVLPYTRSAVIGGIFLGLGRALGETMAVTFVLGNAMHLSASLLDPGTSIASTIANQFSEAVGQIGRASCRERVCQYV